MEVRRQTSLPCEAEEGLADISCFWLRVWGDGFALAIGEPRAFSEGEEMTARKIFVNAKVRRQPSLPCGAEERLAYNFLL